MGQPVNSAGAAPKPDSCYQSCVLSAKGNGFCSDWVGRSPKIAFLQSNPTKADVLARKPMTSFKGLFFYLVLRPNNLTWDDVIISHVLRCSVRYPVGKERKVAEQACRQYDGLSRDTLGLPTIATGLHTFSPNWFQITYDFGDARTLEAWHALLEADVQKALRFAAKGYRPLLVQGKEPMELLAPWLTGTGGLAKHRGDWWEGSLPWGQPSTSAPTFKRDLIPAEELLMSLPDKKKKPSTTQLNLF